MALNKFMHPRNIYKEKKPNFRELAVKYPEFRRHASQETSGKVTINFKEPDALRALSTALLKEDFGLDVNIPADRLVPTIPLRLNYIHWIEDILKTTWNDKIRGIDVGTGASCIYPLLGARMNGWKFLASEQDEKSTISARKNVEQNGLQHLIQVENVQIDSGLKELLPENDAAYDFCMCNPPFFGSQEEADGEFHRDGRSKPHAASTANATESVTWGGEFCFVNRLIKDSLQLRETIRVYTSMVGKKLNLTALKDELHNHKVPKVCSTEFCQGKTMRWGLAWSFDPNITFPKSHFKEKKKKLRPPLALCIPIEIAIEFKTFCIYVVELLEELKISFVEVKQNNWILILALIVTENNWSNQRQKRRKMLREQAQSTAAPENLDTDASTENANSKSQESHTVKKISDFPETGLVNPIGNSLKENPQTSAVSRMEISDKESDIPHLSECSDKVVVRSASIEIQCSENDNICVAPNAISSEIAKTFPNIEQTILSTRKHKRSDDCSNLESADNNHHSKKARLEEAEKNDEDVNPAESFIEKDDLKNAVDFPESSSVSFVDLTTDSPSPPATVNDLNAKGKDTTTTTPYLFKCNLNLKRNKSYVLLELESLDGENRELMQQLLQDRKSVV